jgi:copper oxidase (laccase) domain-containing protein
MLAFSADCLPIGLARVNGTPRLALLHAGRLGLLDGVVEAGVAALGGRLTAVIGPGIVHAVTKWARRSLPRIAPDWSRCDARTQP